MWDPRAYSQGNIKQLAIPFGPLHCGSDEVDYASSWPEALNPQPNPARVDHLMDEDGGAEQWGATRNGGLGLAGGGRQGAVSFLQVRAN